MGHLSRTQHTPNADPSRTAQNEWLVDPGPDLGAAIDRVIDRAGIDGIRKDAVIANDILMSVSPEWFRPDNPEGRGTWRPERLKAFKAEAEAMLRETFGPRLVGAVLHLDEATPHIQAIVVPVMPGKEDRKKLRLSSKDMFGPKGLTTLQQRWEDRMVEHGVGRRLKGSRARHTTLREYYGALEETRSQKLAPKLKLSDPPVRGRFESTEKHKEKVDQWKRDQRKALKAELQPLAKQAAMGRLYDAERRAGQEMRGKLSETQLTLNKTFEELDLAKEQIAALRQSPLNEVAIALDYTGEIGPKENAIDLVKRVGGLDYKQSVAWLAQRFGPDFTATAAREKALEEAQEAAQERPVLTPADKTKRRLVSQQLRALGAPEYRVTVMREKDGKQIGFNLGKDADGGPERFFKPVEVEWLIPRLTAENARGGNIYVTPIDKAARHVLIDDLTGANLEHLRNRGYSPANVLESSPGSFQAILKIPAKLDKDATNEWFKDLNRELGDPKITGLRHPFRLAGFQNAKPKHREADNGRLPFVKLVEAVNRICGHATAQVRAYIDRMKPDLDAKGPEARPGPPGGGA